MLRYWACFSWRKNKSVFWNYKFISRFNVYLLNYFLERALLIYSFLIISTFLFIWLLWVFLCLAIFFFLNRRKLFLLWFITIIRTSCFRWIQLRWRFGYCDIRIGIITQISFWVLRWLLLLLVSLFDLSWCTPCNIIWLNVTNIFLKSSLSFFFLRLFLFFKKQLPIYRESW